MPMLAATRESLSRNRNRGAADPHARNTSRRPGRLGAGRTARTTAALQVHIGPRQHSTVNERDVPRFSTVLHTPLLTGSTSRPIHNPLSDTFQDSAPQQGGARCRKAEPGTKMESSRGNANARQRPPTTGQPNSDPTAQPVDPRSPRGNSTSPPVTPPSVRPERHTP